MSVYIPVWRPTVREFCVYLQNHRNWEFCVYLQNHSNWPRLLVNVSLHTSLASHSERVLCLFAKSQKLRVLCLLAKSQKLRVLCIFAKSKIFTTLVNKCQSTYQSGIPVWESFVFICKITEIESFVFICEITENWEFCVYLRNHRNWPRLLTNVSLHTSLAFHSERVLCLFAKSQKLRVLCLFVKSQKLTTLVNQRQSTYQSGITQWENFVFICEITEIDHTC